MYISDLRLYQFRNIQSSHLQFNERLNVITGKNGQGKTNLVEAIQILSTTKSFRTAKFKECIQWNKKEASIFATINDSLGKRECGVIFEKDKKKLLLDNNPVKPVLYIGSVTSVTFSPSDIEIIKGQASIRRQFLDKHMVDYQPSFLSDLLQYQKALKTKLELLNQNASNDKLDPWDLILSELSLKIFIKRKEFLTKLETAAKKKHQSFSSVDGEISFSLESNIDIENISVEEIFKLYRSVREKDQHSQRVSKGPHRDDFVIRYGGVKEEQQSARFYASQGQSKSLALSLKLAIIDLIKQERLEYPIVVLDDVDSELDGYRLEKLYQTVTDTEAQVFVTGTSPNKALEEHKSSANFFSVEEGNFTHITY